MDSVYLFGMVFSQTVLGMDLKVLRYDKSFSTFFFKEPWYNLFKY